MGITHVIRGEEWLLSTPKHVLLYDALGFDRPSFVHLPLLLNEDRTKMSKRKGDFSVQSFRERGFTSDAMINFVALLGWTPDTAAAFSLCSNEKTEKNNTERRSTQKKTPENDSQEDEPSFSDLFSCNELVSQFDLQKLNVSAAVVNKEKLRWMNRKHIQAMNECPVARPRLMSELRRSFLPECESHNTTVAGVLIAMTKFNELDEDRNGFLEGSEITKLGEWMRDGLQTVHGGAEVCGEMDKMILKKLDTDGDGRLSFEEFNHWFRDSRRGLLRLLHIAARDTSTFSSFSHSIPIPAIENENEGSEKGVSTMIPGFTCRNSVTWPCDEYLSAAVRHVGKRMTSLADFPKVSMCLFMFKFVLRSVYLIKHCANIICIM